MRLGVLALQGDHAAHARWFGRALAARGSSPEVEPVRRPEALRSLDALVLPGGESTTMLRLLAADGLDSALLEFVRRGGAVFGTCAGAILLARAVHRPEQAGLGLLDAAIERNAYGRQIDSTVTRLRVDPDEPALAGAPLDGVFIRAPRFLELGPAVEPLAWRGDDPVLVRQERLLVATFHPELSEDLRVAQLFLELASSGRAEKGAA